MWAVRVARWLHLASLGITIAAGCSGCGFVTTDQPLYNEQQAVFDPQLLGIWVGHSQPGQAAEVVIIARGEGKRYRVSSPDPTPNLSGATEEDLVRIGKYEYLFPHTPESVGTVLSLAGRVQVSGRRMRISVLNGPAMMEELRRYPGLLAHREQPAEIPGPTMANAPSASQPAATSQPTTQPAWTNIVLTDTPEKIRRLLVEHEDDPRWFTEVLVLNRVTPPIRR